MAKSKIIVLLVLFLHLLSVSCEKKDDPYVNSITFDGNTIYNVTSLLYNNSNQEHIVYFSRFVEDGQISESDYIYCIIGEGLIGKDVNVMESGDAFEWVIVIDGNNYIITEAENTLFDSGSFKVDVAGENFYTVEADFITFDNKSFSIRWQGYFSYGEFYAE